MVLSTEVLPDCGSFFEPIEKKVTEQLLPSLFGCEISQSERAVFSPHSNGWSQNTVHSATSNYDTSRKLTDPIIGALKGLNNFDLDM